MRVLFVNHTFPPESFSGSEIYVLHLAKALHRQGNEAAVFYRYANPDKEEYLIQRDEFDGIPTYKINHTYRYVQSFQDIYLDNVIMAKFGHFLREWKPDIVHFNHTTNLSLSLVKEAKSAGCAVVYTLHDYWLLCQRGQLLKRDLSLCTGPTMEGCRECLSLQLLKGRMKRWVSPLLQRPKRTASHNNVLRQFTNLRQANIQTPVRDYVGLTCFEMEDTPGETLLTHPPAEVTFPLSISKPGILKTAIAMHPSTYEKAGEGVLFEIEYEGRLLFSRELHPKKSRSDHGWHSVEIPLQPTSPRSETITFRTRPTSDDPQFCTAGWHLPRVESNESIQPEKKLRSERQQQIKDLAHRAMTHVADTISAFSVLAQEGLHHRKQWVQQVLEQVDQFVAPSRFLMDFYIRHGLPKEKIIYADYGFVYPQCVIPFKPIQKPLIFGFIGTWIPSKGLDIALKAFQSISPRDARFIVHGYFPGYDGYEDYEIYLRSLAGEAVEFRGKYQPNQVFDLLEKMDCLIMPSIWYENSPLTIHEAFLAHLPVITSDNGGMAELVSQGGGITFRQRDPESLRAVIEKMIEEPGRLERLRRRIPDVKSISENANEMLDLYHEVMKANKTT